ncbi:MAG: tetratricopeptide repeat-containing serine protease family protein [Firmicutes bacterium]|nr:tetratricopeptide repeat-containing serine protease family protein [Bacillota bacterium]
MKCSYCGGENDKEKGQCLFCGETVGVENAKKKQLASASVTEKKELNLTTNTILASADFMDDDALVNLGKAFLNGVGQEKDYEASYQLFYKAAQKGNSEAMFYVAEQTSKGYGVSVDIKNAIWWYLQAARTGSKQAQSVLAETFKSEMPVQKDESVYSENSRLKEAVLKVRPFCVEITAFTDKKNAGAGSGCIISPTYILTNYHVIEDKRIKKPHKIISMRFHESTGEEKPHPLKVVAHNAKEDIAVCEFDDGTKINADNFPKLIDAHTLELGDELFTIGNMLGRGLGLSTGVVAKEIEFNVYGKSEAIRTNMSINGGNSGGAVFDFDGNIIGLITFTPPSEDGNSRAHGISYAVTSNTISKMFE